MALDTSVGKSKVVSEAKDSVIEPVNWDQVQWFTHTQETGDQIVFDTIGDVFVGMFTGKQVAQKDGDDFTILSFTGTDGKPYQTNAGWKLEQAFEDIPPQTIVRLTYVKDIDTGQPSPLKDFRVDVAYAKSEQQS
jgi:hypothetical protein